MTLQHGDKFRLVMLLALCFILALGSFWLVEIMRRHTIDASPTTTKTAPDYYVENFQLIKIPKDATAHYHLTGTRLIHQPATDSYQIEQPTIQIVDTDRPPLSLRAQRALINHDHSKIEMIQQVNVYRPAAANASAMQMTSDYLQLSPNTHIIETPQYVTIRVGTASLSGVGMHANTKTQAFALFHQVRGHYPLVN